jgi:hypothetical protein
LPTCSATPSSTLLQAVIDSVAGLHPAVRMIMGHIDATREAACDDRVVAATGAARQYASALMAAATAVGANETQLAPAAAGSRSLRQRIERLLDPRRGRAFRVARTATLGFSAALVAVLTLIARLPPAVTFVDGGTGRVETPSSPRASALEPGAQLAGAIAPDARVPAAPAADAARMQPASRKTTASERNATAASAGHGIAAAEETRPEGTEDPPEHLAAPGRPPTPVLASSRLGGDFPLLMPPAWSVEIGSTTPPDSRSTAPSLWSGAGASAIALASTAARDASSAGDAAKSAGASIGAAVTRAANAFAAAF